MGAGAHSGRPRTYEARLADGRWLQVNERRTRDGGYVSVGADITARSLPFHPELQLGVLTALVGAPFLLVLILRTRTI